MYFIFFRFCFLVIWLLVRLALLVFFIFCLVVFNDVLFFFVVLFFLWLLLFTFVFKVCIFVIVCIFVFVFNICVYVVVFFCIFVFVFDVGMVVFIVFVFIFINLFLGDWGDLDGLIFVLENDVLVDVLVELFGVVLLLFFEGENSLFFLLLFGSLFIFNLNMRRLFSFFRGFLYYIVFFMKNCGFISFRYLIEFIVIDFVIKIKL